VILIHSRQHVAEVFRHLRYAHGLTKRNLGLLLHVSPRTIEDRESCRNGIPTDALIDTAHVLGFRLALIPQRHPGARDTGTGWPA
jgi:hypothetical protein